MSLKITYEFNSVMDKEELIVLQNIEEIMEILVLTNHIIEKHIDSLDEEKLIKDILKLRQKLNELPGELLE